MSTLTRVLWDKIEIFIPGEPVSWRAHAGFGRKAFNPRIYEKQQYQYIIRSQLKKQIMGAVELTILYTLPIPKSLSKKKREAMQRGDIAHVKRPDLDNLNKFLCDCLKGICFEDDSCICRILAQKAYGDHPMTQVYITTMEQANGKEMDSGSDKASRSTA